MPFSMLSMNLGLKSLEKLIKGQKRPKKAKKGQKRPKRPTKAIQGHQRPKLQKFDFITIQCKIINILE